MIERLRQIIVDSVRLEHLKPQDIGEHANLVGDLDFDSIDLLEVAMSIEDELGVKMPEEDPSVYTSLRTLLDYIEAQQP